MSGGTQAGKAYVLIQIRDQVSQGLKTMEKKFRDFGTSVSLSSGIALAGAAGAISWPLKLAGDMEQTTTSFRVFLGDAEKAKNLVQTLDDISLTTPYEIADMAESARLMMASGLTDAQIPDMLAMIGDIAQGDAESMYLLSKAFADVAQNGKLMAQENNQFRNSGFNVIGVMAEQLALARGGTKEQYMPMLRKQMEEGVISVWDVAEAMRYATSEGGRFHGMQEEQAQTFKGLMSTLWDYINRGLRRFGELMMPTAKLVIRFGMNIADFVGKMIDRFHEFFSLVGTGLMSFAAIAAVATFIGGAFMALSFVLGIVGSFIAVIFTKAFAIFLGVAAAITVAVIALGTIFYTFKDQIYAVANYLYMAWRPAIESVWFLYETVKLAIFGIADALTQGKFQEAWGIALKAMEAGFYELLNLASFIGSLFVTELSAIFPIFGHVISWAGDMMGGIYNAILGGRLDIAFAIIWNNIKIVWQRGVNFLSLMWETLVAIFNIAAAGVKYTFQSLGNAMMLAFETAFHGIRIAAAEIVRVVGKALDAIGQGQLVAGMHEAIKPNETMLDILERRAAAQEALHRQMGKEVGQAGLRFTMAEVRGRQKLLELQQEGMALDGMAKKAQQDSGIDNLADRAAKAREELQAAIKAAARPEVDPQDKRNPISKAENLINQDDLMGKYMKSNARGTYSAIAATYLGREANDYEKQTANNTKATADGIKNLNLTFGA